MTRMVCGFAKSVSSPKACKESVFIRHVHNWIMHDKYVCIFKTRCKKGVFPKEQFWLFFYIFFCLRFKLRHSKYNPWGVRGCSDEGTRLPPMWPGFKSRRRRHMWVEFVAGSLPCSERFFSGYSGFPLSWKTNTFKFQLVLERTETFQRVLRTPKCSVGKQITKFYQTSKSSGSTT